MQNDWEKNIEVLFSCRFHVRSSFYENDVEHLGASFVDRPQRHKIGGNRWICVRVEL
jgi:hypothetical protein